eukprot:scaffold59731_cov37-Prasinocladus_malaysianus.AAC.1
MLVDRHLNTTVFVLAEPCSKTKKIQPSAAHSIVASGRASVNNISQEELIIGHNSHQMKTAMSSRASPIASLDLMAADATNDDSREASLLNTKTQSAAAVKGEHQAQHPQQSDHTSSGLNTSSSSPVICEARATDLMYNGILPTKVANIADVPSQQ